MNANAMEDLFNIKDAYAHSPENDLLFLEAMREMVDWHCSRSPVFQGICRQWGFSAADLKRPGDIFSIPHIMVTAFKEMRLVSVADDQITFTFTSSGTTGQKSQINFDEGSRKRQAFTRQAVVESLGLADYQSEVNYLVFSYDAAAGGARGAAHAFSMYTTFARAKETFFAITADSDSGEPRFRLEECIQTLERYAQSGLPLRIAGFPAFVYAALLELEQSGQSFRFGPESLMFLGGGWKQYSGQAIAFDQYAALVEKVLGIKKHRIREFYGMVEHGVPYMSCEEGCLHVPIYSRVCAVDPGTLEALPAGETGLFKLLTPYITSQPSISVLSTDLGSVQENCPCGRPGAFLSIKGRGGVKKHQGCAISASQILGQ